MFVIRQLGSFFSVCLLWSLVAPVLGATGVDSANSSTAVPVAPAIPATAKTPSGLVPKGWSLESSAIGDLNKDGLPDCAIIVSDTKNSSGANPAKQRKLVIALAESDGLFHKSIENESAVMLEGGAVFRSPLVTIKKDVLTIEHYGGSRWRHKTDHKYQLRNGDWLLIGYTRFENDSAKAHSRESIDVNLLTGEVAGSVEGGHTHSARFMEVRSPLIADDRPSAADWTAPAVWLDYKLASCPIVSIQSVHNKSTLFLRVQLQESNKLMEEEVTLRDAKGATIQPLTQKEINAYGYVLASYDLKSLRAACGSADGATANEKSKAGPEAQSALAKSAEKTLEKDLEKDQEKDPELLRATVEITPAHSGCNKTFSTALTSRAGGILLTKAKGLPSLSEVDVRGDFEIHPFLWPVPED